MFFIAANSQNIDIISESINLKIIPTQSHEISGHAKITSIITQNNTDTIWLQLLHLQIDSIKISNIVQPNYYYNDTVIKIPLIYAANSGDTVIVLVYYHGSPVIDPSGWGGFYFSGNIAYNLGVGFQDVPHSYGRVWFPCIDDFNEKAIYDLTIITDTSDVAICGGSLMSETIDTITNLKTYHWKLNEPIPSYLVSVVVGPYLVYEDTYHSITGDTIPIKIYTTSAYINKVAGSFVHLKDILAGYEHFFGPYKWERVGYVTVPFNSGAMEHATNIAYPQVCVTGDVTYESLYAHELSHHWFGDLVTTASAENMWINEGWATFSEAFYNSFVYDQETYMRYIEKVHAEALKDAAYDDGGWYALSNIPQSVTYGTTTYKKGASVVHTLRYYMGDSLFFSSVKQMLDHYQWGNLSSEGLKNALSQYSGIDLTDFFNAWVFSPGYLHFSIDSFETQIDGNSYNINLYIRQRLYHKQEYGQNNIIEINLVDSSFNVKSYRIHFSGVNYDTTISCPFNPALCITDLYDKTLDASTSEYKFINSTGTYSFANEYFSFAVAGTVSDTAFLFVRHNFVKPDGFKENIPGIMLDTLRYWEVKKIFPTDLYYQAKFYFGTSGTYEHLDNGFLDFDIDSLTLLYRKDASDDWKVVSSHASGSQYGGYIILDEPLQSGEYVLGEKNGYSPNNIIKKNNSEIVVYPNPVKANLTILLKSNNFVKLNIYDETGKKIFSKKITKNRIVFNTKKIRKGLLTFMFEDKKGEAVIKKVIVK